MKNTEKIHKKRYLHTKRRIFFLQKYIFAVVETKNIYFRTPIPNKVAQMAESVDALVSNTNEVTLVPVRLRLWVRKIKTLIIR
jgi:hypothetical protein